MMVLKLVDVGREIKLSLNPELCTVGMWQQQLGDHSYNLKFRRLGWLVVPALLEPACDYPMGECWFGVLFSRLISVGTQRASAKWKDPRHASTS